MATPTLDAHPEVLNVCKIAHAVNQSWAEYSTGEAQAPWDDLDDDTKDSVAQGVLFHINNPEATDEDSHNSWLATKEAQGWTYGPVKDAEAKKHPCVLPFNALPRWQQYKDRLFRTIVRAAVS